MDTLETILNAPDNTLVPVSWVRQNFLPEPDAELVAYRVAIATAGAFYAAVARGDLPNVLLKRGAAGHLSSTDDTSENDMGKQFSKSIGERGATVRVYTRKGTAAYYMDYFDNSGKRIRKPIVDPVTGWSVTNRQVAIATATAFQMHRQRDILEARLKERVKNFGPEIRDQILGTDFASYLPDGVKVFTEAPGATVEDDADASNIRLCAAWDELGAQKPTKASKSDRLDGVAAFIEARDSAIAFFGNIRLAEITQGKLHAYEKSLSSYSMSVRRKRIHVYLRMLFEHFKSVVPSLRELDIKKVSSKAKSHLRYTKDEMKALEAHLDTIHPDAADLFYAMLASGWRIDMARQIESSEVIECEHKGKPVLRLRVDIRKVKGTSDVLEAMNEGEKTWSYMVLDPKAVAMIQDRAKRNPKGYLFAIEGDRPLKNARSKTWFGDRLKELESNAGVARVKGRSTHALKREFATRSNGDPLRTVTSRTSEAVLSSTYSEGGERAVEELLENMGIVEKR